MALALVELKKRRGNRVYSLFDYISLDAAKLGVEIQGEEHSVNEWSKVKIIKIFNTKGRK